MSSISSLAGASALQPATIASLNAQTNSAAAAAAAATAASAQTPDFMTLLIAQMQNQDPTNPTDPTSFITELADFSNVQGITQLNTSLTSLLSGQSLSQSVSLIGATVSYTNAAGKTANGTVSSVSMSGGQPQLVIGNNNVSMSQVQSVSAS
jgi:flagellar basal-body rod modification protein FlgD